MDCTKQFGQVKWQLLEQTSWCRDCVKWDINNFMIVHINSTVVWLWCLYLTIIQQVWVVYEQIVNEAQPSWLIVLAQQNGGFVIFHLLVYTKYLQDVVALYTVLTSCETAIHSCWWWADWPRHCSNDCHFTDQTASAETMWNNIIYIL